jgi:3-oxoacyl-[acyl-carrier-protein] synthase II
MVKKIVVTGLGTSSPLGGNVEDTWKALLACESGVSTLEQEWVSQYNLPVTFAAQAKVHPTDVLDRVETRRLDPSSQFALIAAREAWADAGSPDVDPLRISVDYATGIGGIWTLIDAWEALR